MSVEVEVRSGFTYHSLMQSFVSITLSPEYNSGHSRVPQAITSHCYYPALGGPCCRVRVRILSLRPSPCHSNYSSVHDVFSITLRQGPGKDSHVLRPAALKSQLNRGGSVAPARHPTHVTRRRPEGTGSVAKRNKHKLKESETVGRLMEMTEVQRRGDSIADILRKLAVA